MSSNKINENSQSETSPDQWTSNLSKKKSCFLIGGSCNATYANELSCHGTKNNNEQIDLANQKPLRWAKLWLASSLTNRSSKKIYLWRKHDNVF